MDTALSVLNKGGIVLFPTDTIYGLGVDATNADAVKRLRELKGRPAFAELRRGKAGKPISIMVSDMAMAEKYAVVTPLAKKLAEKFLPGKLTLVLEAKDTLSDEVTAGTGTVGIRIPNHPITLQMVKDFGKPITATSANVSDMPTMNSVPEILKQFGGAASSIYGTGGEETLPDSLPSTVVDARGEKPIILRTGAVTESDIHAAL